MKSVANILSSCERIGAIAITIACLAVVAFGTPLDAYKTKIDSAKTRASEIENTLIQEGVAPDEARAFVEYMRRDFSRTEKVEWSGGSVEVSHDWLLQATQNFEQEDEPNKKIPIATAIREHLSSVSFKLHELEQAEAATRTKDEDKQKLAEILRRQEYQKVEAGGESVFQRWLREFTEWLAGLWPKPKIQGQGFSGMETVVAVMRILLYIGLAAVVGFLIFKVAPLLFPNLKRSSKAKKKDRVILGETIAENQTASDLIGDAERLAREGNLRGAIRKGYIALLCDLNDRKVIGLARHKTNRDYLRDVRSRRELHPRMKVVTETFERHWYGIQESGEQDWTRFRDEYDKAIRSV